MIIVQHLNTYTRLLRHSTGREFNLLSVFLSHPFIAYRGFTLPLMMHDSFMSDDGVKDVKTREMFVNAQWALGGEGTGAPVSVSSHLLII